MTDPAEDISDALVVFANGQASEFDLAYNAQNPEDVNALLKAEHRELQVFFFPYSDEEEEKRGRGGEIIETIIVTMMVIRKIDAQFTRKRLGGFTRQLKKLIREGGKMAGYTYMRAETVTKFDVDQLHDSKQYLTTLRLHYLGYDRS